MAKSRKRHRDPVPSAAARSRLGVPGRTASPADLIPRAKPAIDLEVLPRESLQHQSDTPGPGRSRDFRGRGDVPGRFLGASA